MIRAFLLITGILLLGCDSTEKGKLPTDQSSTLGSSEIGKSTEQKTDNESSQESLEFVAQTSSVIESTFAMLQAQAENLSIATKALAEKPTEETLKRAQSLWPDAHDAYIATRLFRQWAIILEVNHPELNFAQVRPELIHTNHSRIDQHPLIPGYLDKVQGYPFSGLMNSELEITEEVLNHEHALGDKAYVALGFHALEFMLFGERDFPRTLKDLNARPEENTEEQSVPERRRQYIELLGTLLREDIDALALAWKGTNSFYPSAFSRVPVEKLSTTLRQIAEVELEACARIQEILNTQPNQPVHDSANSIAARIKVAEAMLESLKPRR